MSTRVMSAEDFPTQTTWGTPEEKQRRLRIVVAHAAYAYEIMDDPIMPDWLYDRLAELIKRDMPTGHPVLDEFFRTQFSPMTGMWIRNHPELDGIDRIYRRYKTQVRAYFERKVGGQK